MLFLILTYLAGVLTILSPCILPVLPFVFARSEQPFLKSGLPLLIGMAFTFSIFSALAIAGGAWISQANEFGRIIAIVLLTVFGLSLIFPTFSEKLMQPLANIGARIGGGPQESTFRSSFLIGIGTGLLWAPCAGPILGLVLTGAASRGNVAQSAGLLLAYSLGAATSLAIALVSGNRFLKTLKRFLGVDRVVKKVLGVAVLIGVAAIVLKLDRTLLTQLSKVETVSIENRLLAYLEKDQSKKTLGVMPSLKDAGPWIGSEPLTTEALRGKVVLVDFWTYSCINCLRTLPYIKSWTEKYKDDGLIVIGIHTPEFAFEKNEQNVRNAVQELGVNYVVALDNDFKVWNAFGTRFWPTHFLIDRSGMVRDQHAGEGGYAETEKKIRQLLSENSMMVHAKESELDAKGALMPAGPRDQKKSHETYLGYARQANFVSSPAVVRDVTTAYTAPAVIAINQWALNGSWTISREKATVMKAGARLRYRFHARDLHLVMGSEKAVRIRVTIDGKAPGASRGQDIDESGSETVQAERLYQLIRQNESEGIKEHLFEIEFLDAGASAFALTFG